MDVSPASTAHPEAIRREESPLFRSKDLFSSTDNKVKPYFWDGIDPNHRQVSVGNDRPLNDRLQLRNRHSGAVKKVES